MDESSLSKRRVPATLAQFILASIALIFALHFGQAFVVPIVLAILLAFCLTPMIIRLERIGLSAKTAVIVSFGATLLSFAVAGWITFEQFGDFSTQLPIYQRNLNQRISDLEKSIRNGIASSLPRQQVVLPRADQNLILPQGQAVSDGPTVIARVQRSMAPDKVAASVLEG